LLIEDGRLVGLMFRRTRIEKGRVEMTDETFEARGPVVISSIGSIPEPIAGIEMNGELFDFKDWDIGKLEGFPSVFSVGNVVTGKGNIVASRKHATHVSEAAIEAYLGVGDDDRASAESTNPAVDAAAPVADEIARVLSHAKAPTDAEARKLRERIAKRQSEVGFHDYKSWMEKIGEPC
jgi:hypothetical protein